MNVIDWYVLIGSFVCLCVFFVFPVLSFVLFALYQYWIHYPYGRKKRKKPKQ